MPRVRCAGAAKVAPAQSALSLPILKFGWWQRLSFSQGLGPSRAALSRNASATISNEGGNSTIRWDGTSADNIGRETHVKGHPAPLPTFALLGKDTLGSGPQGPELELSRYSGMDAAPQAHTDDRRLSAHSHPSDRGGVLLRHAAHSSRHREVG